MKLKYIVLLLMIFAWPLTYLYGLQLGAVSFLLLALFFSYVTVKEVQKVKQLKMNENDVKKKEKVKRNIR